MENKTIQKPTIKLGAEVKSLLDNLKVHPRDSYEDVVNRLVKDVKKTMDIIEKEGEAI